MKSEYSNYIELLIDGTYEFGIVKLLEEIRNIDSRTNMHQICLACGNHGPESQTCIQCPLGVFMINERHREIEGYYATIQQIDAYLKKKILPLGKVKLKLDMPSHESLRQRLGGTDELWAKGLNLMSKGTKDK